MTRSAVAFALSLLLLPSLTQASWFNAAPNEARQEFGMRAVREANPMITAGPEIRDYRALGARAATVNPNTCGFIDGNANDWISCNNNNKCTVTENGVGCCNNAGCGGWVATCYDFTAVGTKCTTCTRDDAAYCSTKAYGWCATYLYPNGVIDFLCTTAPQTDTMLYTPTTTYAPQNHDQPIPTATGGSSAAASSTKASTASSKASSASGSSSSKASTSSATSATSSRSTSSAGSATGAQTASTTSAASSSRASTAATTTASTPSAASTVLVSFFACVFAMAAVMFLL